MSSEAESESDVEIMRAYLEGDPHAFSKLFRLYAPVLSGYFMRRGQRSHDVPDLLQQTFLQLHRARHDYRVGEPLRPWLFTIAHNVSCDQQRRRQRRPETFCDFELHAAAEQAGPDPSRSEQNRALTSALDQLPAATRALLTEHWFDDRNWSQIADRSGVPATTLRVRAHRACAELRRFLERSSFELA